jgi:hypothetical protein
VAKLIADQGYDTDAFRSYLKEQGIKPVIPGKSNRKTRVRYDKLLLSPQGLPPHRHAL